MKIIINAVGAVLLFTMVAVSLLCCLNYTLQQEDEEFELI